MKWLLRSLGLALFGSGLVFPFYIAFIKEAAANFSQFGMAYGLLVVSGTVAYGFMQGRSHGGRKHWFLLLTSWGLAFVLLLFPMVVSIWQAYLLQIVMGVLAAMLIECVKAIHAAWREDALGGKPVGRYYGRVTVAFGLAAIAAGYIADFLLPEAILYVGSIVLFISGLFVLRTSPRALEIARQGRTAIEQDQSR